MLVGIFIYLEDPIYDLTYWFSFLLCWPSAMDDDYCGSLM